MSPQRLSAAAAIYQLKVTLKRSKPPIWRRLHVRGDSRLSTLHDIIQTAMGWRNCHLHQFKVGQQLFGVPDPEFWEDVIDERRVTLHQLPLREKSRLAYEYDFGDGWDHDIIVEKIFPPDPAVVYPRCITGKRACPPEDVGGMWGYTELLEIIGDPLHGEHDAMTNWIGRTFDSEAFNLDTVNGRLLGIR